MLVIKSVEKKNKGILGLGGKISFKAMQTGFCVPTHKLSLCSFMPARLAEGGGGLCFALL